ncbi:MAG: hypothetical protein H7836_14565 [Magnetococcus sp. YQC-3]
MGPLEPFAAQRDEAGEAASGVSLPGSPACAAQFLPVLSVVEGQLRRIVAGEPPLDILLLTDQVFRLMSDLYRQSARAGLGDLSALAYEVAQAFGSVQRMERGMLLRLALLSLVAVRQMRRLLSPASAELRGEEARQIVTGLLTTW